MAHPPGPAPGPPDDDHTDAPAATGERPGRPEPTPDDGRPDAPDGLDAPDLSGLSVLGATVRRAIDHVECFPAPPGCTAVRFTTEELASICPVTGQPDLSSVVIEYGPDRHCVESKSLKLYLWGFRDRPIFAEALAATISAELQHSARPRWVRVVVTQRPRGGIETQTTSELGPAPPTR